jgi:hypothetical protein
MANRPVKPLHPGPIATPVTISKTNDSPQMPTRPTKKSGASTQTSTYKTKHVFFFALEKEVNAREKPSIEKQDASPVLV